MKIKSLNQLQLISKKIADNTSKSDFILLFGEIGSGKTTFARNFINYLQEKENSEKTEVLSPTFNLLYEYNFKDYKINHYDLYRLKNTKEINQLGIMFENRNCIKIVEWPELINQLIKDKIELHFFHTQNENERELQYKCFGKWNNFKLNEI